MLAPEFILFVQYLLACGLLPAVPGGDEAPCAFYTSRELPHLYWLVYVDVRFYPKRRLRLVPAAEMKDAALRHAEMGLKPKTRPG